MDRKTALVILACALLATGIRSVLAESSVNVVVAGYINHGPMQPTVDAIRSVVSKYNDSVNVTWIDMGTTEGQEYMSEHGLSAHLNILIDGRYQYEVGNRSVTFQWFEGQEWTKDDLDKVISDLLSGTGQAVGKAPDAAGSGGFAVPAAALLVACAAAGVFYITYFRKRRV